jgi:hypothetical protein
VSSPTTAPNDGARKTLEVHPLASCYPLLQGQAFDELVADIKAHGLAVSIELYGGMILDGRNRYRACQQLGIEPTTITYQGNDPVARVESLNGHRRHLTQSQRAMAAAKIASMRQGARTDLLQNCGKSQADAATQYKVSARSISDARAVLRHGTPEVATAVELGRVPVSRAVEIAKLPAAEQCKALAAPKPKPKPERQQASAPPISNTPPPAAHAARRREHGPFAAARDRAEGLIAALEALYADAEPRVRALIRDRLARMLCTLDHGGDRLAPAPINGATHHAP